MNATLSAAAGTPRVGAAARAAMTPIRLDRQRAWVTPAAGVVQIAQLWTGLPDDNHLFLVTTAAPGQPLETFDIEGEKNGGKWAADVAFRQHNPAGFEAITEEAARVRMADMGHDRGQCTSCGKQLPIAGRWCGSCGTFRVVSLAAEREARFQARKARLDADTAIDPRRRAIFLNRTIWDTDEFATFLGITANRVTGLRANITDEDGKLLPASAFEDDGSEKPHPMVFPSLDVILRVMFGFVHPGVEAGRGAEWAEHSNRVVFNPVTGLFVPNLIRRHGAAPGPRK